MIPFRSTNRLKILKFYYFVYKLVGYVNNLNISQPEYVCVIPATCYTIQIKILPSAYRDNDALIAYQSRRRLHTTKY